MPHMESHVAMTHRGEPHPLPPTNQNPAGVQHLDLAKTFKALDVDKDGTLSFSECRGWNRPKAGPAVWVFAKWAWLVVNWACPTVLATERKQKTGGRPKACFGGWVPLIFGALPYAPRA